MHKRIMKSQTDTQKHNISVFDSHQQSMQGRRIFDSHSQMGYTLKDMDVVREKRYGLRSCFIFKCRMCNVEMPVWSEKDPEKMDVNTPAVSGTTSSVGGHAQLEEMFSAMDVPVL
ncbi:hypothetical protein PR048_000908 [Dryococelus australis]|uniref:Mutator-like transposase domain-containing protein n=1 Tax=Dryococelus australis TaxID=614101 RepID=A0ABQ9IFX8_9NEOP|nr:hypothetical protein PR048_000908 [Dryococelus australis]